MILETVFAIILGLIGIAIGGSAIAQIVNGKLDLAKSLLLALGLVLFFLGAEGVLETLGVRGLP